MKKKHRPLSRALWPILVSSALSSAPAFALEEKDFQYDTTENLYQVCAAGPEVEGHLIAVFACRAFIEASVQYHDAVTTREGLKRLVCYPQGMTIEDARETFVTWGRANAANAKLMGEQPVKGVVRALAAKYPCTK